MYHLCAVPSEARRGSQRTGVTDGYEPSPWVLGIEPLTSARAASALKGRVTSLALIYLLTFLNFLLPELGFLPPCFSGTGVPHGSWGFKLRSLCLHNRPFPAPAPPPPSPADRWDPSTLGLWFWSLGVGSGAESPPLTSRSELVGAWPVGCVGCVLGRGLKSLSTGTDKRCAV